MGCFWKRVPKVVYNFNKCLSSCTETSEPRKKHKCRGRLISNLSSCRGFMLFSQKIILFHVFNSELCCNRELMSFMLSCFFITLPFNGTAWKTSKFILNGIEDKLIILCGLYKGGVGFLFKNKILNTVSYTVK